MADQFTKLMDILLIQSASLEGDSTQEARQKRKQLAEQRKQIRLIRAMKRLTKG